MKKKAKPARGKPASTAKTLTKIEPVSSFFNFFRPPQEPEDEEVDEDELEELRSALEDDFELGCACTHTPAILLQTLFLSFRLYCMGWRSLRW
jgi:hypothetical protein